MNLTGQEGNALLPIYLRKKMLDLLFSLLKKRGNGKVSRDSILSLRNDLRYRSGAKR
jgi:hypothetical protein